MTDPASRPPGRYEPLASAVDLDDKVELVLRNGSTPIALTHRDRCWTIELYELAPVDRSVYRPRRRRIEGRLAILAYLQAHDPQRLLARVTERLMARHARVDCAFDAVNGGWLLQGAQVRVASAGTALEVEPAVLPESATVR